MGIALLSMRLKCSFVLSWHRLLGMSSVSKLPTLLFGGGNHGRGCLVTATPQRLECCAMRTEVGLDKGL